MRTQYPLSKATTYTVFVGVSWYAAAQGDIPPPISTSAAPPAFLHEPPVQTLFSNSTGTLVSCSASGQPRPSVTWTNETGSPLEPLPGLRRVRPDGTLEFFPFRGDEYRQDVHSARYRCRASNTLGTVVSRSVHVRAMVQQKYEVRVYDDFVIRMNTGVLRCHIPKYVKEYVVVTSWTRSDGFIISVQAIPGKYQMRSTKAYYIFDNTEGREKGCGVCMLRCVSCNVIQDENSKYVAFRTGELHVRRAGPEDSHHSFQCQTKDTLTGAVVSSITMGKLVITAARWKDHTVPPSSFRARPKDTRSHRTAGTASTEPTSGRCCPSGEPGIVFVGGTLVFRRASVQDSAIYVCVVSNGAGVEDKNEIQVLVTEPLEVDMWTRTTEVRSGDTLTLNCSVSGFPVRSVTWFKDGRAITGPSAAKTSVSGSRGGQVSSRRVLMLNQYMLRIQAAQSDDSGVYQCHAENERDSAQAQALVHVRSEPPVLVSNFQDVVVRPEESVSLRCAATGTPLPQITWSFYDIQVQDSSRVRVGDYVSRDGSVISFVNVTRVRHEDGGAYRCEASNVHGSHAHSGRLNVLGPPAVRDMPNRTVVAGRRAVLHCPYYGHPVSRVAWHKDARSLPSSKRVMAHENGSLVLEAVSRNDDQGRYSCSVRNEQGSEAHNHFYLRVLASVTCSVPVGDPPIRLSWLRDGMPLESDSSSTSAVGIAAGHVDDFISTLVFRSLREEHTAVYTCLAANEAASINYSAPLVVYGPQGTEFRTVISSSRMQALVNGSLVIQEVETLDAGGYMCEASNGVGLPLYTIVHVNVHYRPEQPPKPEALNVLSRSVTILWKSPSDGNSPITKYIVQYKRSVGKTRSSLYFFMSW
ncbi:hypothetical protein MRX96_036589 [Rhipicephalus microplus]